MQQGATPCTRHEPSRPCSQPASLPSPWARPMPGRWHGPISTATTMPRRHRRGRWSSLPETVHRTRRATPVRTRRPTVPRTRAPIRARTRPPTPARTRLPTPVRTPRAIRVRTHPAAVKDGAGPPARTDPAGCRSDPAARPFRGAASGPSSARAGSASSPGRTSDATATTTDRTPARETGSSPTRPTSGGWVKLPTAKRRSG